MPAVVSQVRKDLPLLECLGHFFNRLPTPTPIPAAVGRSALLNSQPHPRRFAEWPGTHYTEFCYWTWEHPYLLNLPFHESEVRNWSSYSTPAGEWEKVLS